MEDLSLQAIQSLLVVDDSLLGQHLDWKRIYDPQHYFSNNCPVEQHQYKNSLAKKNFLK